MHLSDRELALSSERSRLLERLQQSLSLSARRKVRLAVVCLSTSVPGTTPTRDAPTRLMLRLRASDTAADLGAGRVAVVLTDLPRLEDAHYAVMRVAGMFAELAGTPLDAGPVSVGVALFPEDGLDAATLLAYAESALTGVQNDSPGGVRYHSPALAHQLVDWLQLHVGLRLALARNDLELRYQPVVEPRTGAILGAEAQLHWQYPGRGLMTPDVLRTVAAQSRLAAQLDEWTLGALCVAADRWCEPELGSLQLSLRLATRTLMQPGFAAAMLAMLEKCGFSVARLTVAFTADALEPATPMAAIALRQMAQGGVRLVLADTGAGAIHLQSLRRLPLYGLCIAPSVVRNVAHDPEHADTGAALVAIARSLNLRIGADGVETREQSVFLRAREVDTLQGPYLGPALRLDDFHRFVDVTYMDWRATAKNDGADGKRDPDDRPGILLSQI